MLVEDGRPRPEALKKELMTLAELEAAAHRQGLGSLAEVERAILEPGGTIAFVARKPTPDTARHEELLARLDHLVRGVAAVRAAVTTR